MRGVSRSSFSVTHGVATKLAFTTQPALTYTADDSISVVVKVQDAYGNTVTTGSHAIDSIALDSSVGSGGTLTSDSSLSKPASAGVASFSDLHVRKAGGPYSIAASDSPLTGASSDSFNVTPGRLGSFAWSNIGQQTAGVQFSPTVTASDA